MTKQNTSMEREIKDMPSFIVKPKKDEDFYVMWSTIVDNAVNWGSRAEFGSENPERLERADKHGTSMIDSDWFGWDDKEFIVYNLPGNLGNNHMNEYASIAREDVREFCENMDDEDVLNRLLIWRSYE